jgi:hypothetical protein
MLQFPAVSWSTEHHDYFLLLLFQAFFRQYNLFKHTVFQELQYVNAILPAYRFQGCRLLGKAADQGSQARLLGKAACNGAIW